jgi:hypothetical protein
VMGGKAKEKRGKESARNADGWEVGGGVNRGKGELASR